MDDPSVRDAGMAGDRIYGGGFDRGRKDRDKMAAVVPDEQRGVLEATAVVREESSCVEERPHRGGLREPVPVLGVRGRVSGRSELRIRHAGHVRAPLPASSSTATPK